MYRFEIYRNPNSIFSRDWKTERERYDKNAYSFERTITPVWNNLVLSWKKEKERVFFRKNLEGEFTLIGADYDWAYDILLDSEESNKHRYLKISEKRDGVWTESYCGFFSIVNGEFDIDNCSVLFSDLLVFDKYSRVIENIEKEKNMIDLPTTHPVSYNINEYPYDQIITTEQITLNSSNFCNGAYLEYPTQLEYGIEYSLYEKKYSVNNVYILESPSGACTYGGTVDIIRTYRRDYQWAAVDPGIAWEEDTDAGEDINGNKRWVRCYKGQCSPSYNLKKTKVHPSTNIPVGDMTCPYCTVFDATYTADVENEEGFENERGRFFTDVIIYAIKDYVDFFDESGNLIVGYQSAFFQSAINPVTGVDNKYRGLIVFQLSDMKVTSDAATKAMYSIKTIEDWFKIFRCFWYIDDDGVFRVEHESFFDNGYSYSGYSDILDISSQGIKTKISYLDNLPQEESLSLLYSVNPDFVGTPIVYGGNIVDRDEDTSTVEYSYSVATDLNQVVSNPEEVSNDGFFLLTADINNITQTATVHTVDGILSDITLSNGYMAVSFLHNNFWKWGRSTNRGYMNKEETDFTQKNVLIHPGVTVLYCDEFDPTKIIKTSFGNGNVEEASLQLKDNKLTMMLSYPL